MEFLRRRSMRISLRGLMVTVLVLCAFLAGRMPVLRRAEEAEELARTLLANELAAFADRTKLTGIIQISKGERQVWIMDSEAHTVQSLREGETLTSANLAVTVTEIRNNQATFETGGISVDLALGK